MRVALSDHLSSDLIQFSGMNKFIFQLAERLEKELISKLIGNGERFKTIEGSRRSSKKRRLLKKQQRDEKSDNFSPKFQGNLHVALNCKVYFKV